jgi:hypothetical protein
MNPLLLIPACYVASAVILANLAALAAAGWWWMEVGK